ncbi:MAG TPA: glycosyltransferase family A protein [Fimbriimonadaceae bacterium]|nr:glycosyltransferase family A protein [Fimbriimonadaceae bacterium]
MATSVSVLIPAYNAEATIERAVSSALSQHPEPKEVLVACDGCTDATAHIARSAGATALELPKANGAVARNAAAKEASGNFFFFLDADDWWEPGKIEAHLKVWKRKAPSFVIDRAVPRLPDGGRAYWTAGLNYDGPSEWRYFLSHNAWASGSSFSVTADNYNRVGGFREQLNKFQDVDFILRCAHECGDAYNISRSYTNYSISDAPSVSKTTEQIEQNLQALFKGWPFVNDGEKEAFASHAYLTAAEVTPWPQSVEFFKKAHWPVTHRFFWKCLYQSLRRRAA